MTLRVVTAATDSALEALVSLAELREQVSLGADDTSHDARLSAYRAAALAVLEAATQRRFLPQTLAWVLPCWPRPFRIPVAPVAPDDLTSIEYVDTNGDAQTLAAADYVARPCGPTLEIRPTNGSTFPGLDPDAPEPVTVTFDVGGEDAAPTVKVALMMLVAMLFADRGDGPPVTLDPSHLPTAVEALIGPERW